MQRFISLITDFGWDGHYPGAMKGAILAINPAVEIVDITHGIAAHGILEAALALRSSYGFFPPLTIHVAVVDPGVGGPRRGILVSSEKHLFVGPDNGILGPVMSELGSFACYELTAAHYFHREVSPTFHGRDIFGPVAAWLSRGIECRHFGRKISDPVRLEPPRARAVPGGLEGEVLYVDRFGNLVTSIRDADLAEALGGRAASCAVEGSDAPIPLRKYYGEAAPGQSCALVGSSGFLEVAVNRGRAAEILGVKVGQKVTVLGARLDFPTP